MNSENVMSSNIGTRLVSVSLQFAAGNLKTGHISFKDQAAKMWAAYSEKHNNKGIEKKRV